MVNRVIRVLQIIIIWIINVMDRIISKQLYPLRCIKRWEIRWVSSDSGKPVVKDDIVLSFDGSCTKVEDQRHIACMLVTCANIHAALRTRLPLRDFLPISNGTVQYINWTTPHMQILELRHRPASASEEVQRREAIVQRGHAIPNIDSMLDGHRPQRGVCHLLPMNG
jgi:hypothetical protein